MNVTTFFSAFFFFLCSNGLMHAHNWFFIVLHRLLVIFHSKTGTLLTDCVTARLPDARPPLHSQPNTQDHP